MYILLYQDFNYFTLFKNSSLYEAISFSPINDKTDYINCFFKLMRFRYSLRDLTHHTYPDIKDLTLKVEGLGFESIHITDHFFRAGVLSLMDNIILFKF